MHCRGIAITGISGIGAVTAALPSEHCYNASLCRQCRQQNISLLEIIKSNICLSFGSIIGWIGSKALQWLHIQSKYLPQINNYILFGLRLRMQTKFTALSV